jgi:hypothetical protein
MIHPKKAVMGGTSVMISIENLEPMMVKDLKRNRSPKTKPTSPESPSHIQFSVLASTGRNIFLLNNVRVLRNSSPMISLRRLTGNEPTLRLADSKAIALIVQNTATSRAENSPRCSVKNSIKSYI